MATTAGASPGPDINIKVKTMAPATHELCISSQASVFELKQELSGITSIPVDRQRLIYHGRVMRDDQTLAELGVGEGHTVHLVERPADAPPAAGAGGSGNPAASANPRQPRGAGMAPGDMDVPMAFDMGALNLGPILQNLFSSLGGQGGAAGGPAGGSGEHLPPQHLLHTLDAYLSSLQRGQPSLQPIRVISLDPRIMPEELNRQFVQGIQSVLSAADLPARLQQLMRELPATGAAAAGGGASAGSSQSQPAASQQAQLHLALASVGRLLQRSTTYVHDHLEPGLSQAARQLADTSALDAQALRTLGGDLRRTSGLLNGAAALLVELARATAAAMLAAEGNLVPLMANTATVLELQGNEPPVPSFPQMYPQMTWMNDAPQQPPTSAAPGAAGGESAARSGGGRGGAQGAAAAGGLPAMLGSMLGGFPAQVAVGPTTTWSATTPDERTATASAGSMTFAMPAGALGYINHPMGRAGDMGGMPGAMQHAAMGGGTPPGMSDVEASLAWQIATAVMASLGPVVQSAADAAVVQVRQARQQIRQQQATEHAQVVSRVVADSLSRVLETAGTALQGGLNRIEQGLQEVEQRQGHEANLMDIARVLQSTFAPQLRPLVDGIGRAVDQASAAATAAQQARAAAGHAATAAAAAGAAATAAAAAAGTGAPTAAAPAPSSSQPSSTPAAPSSSAPAPAATPTAAAAPAAGPSSSGPAADGPAGSSGQGGAARGMGLPSRGPTLPSKRKAPAPVSTGAGSSSGGAGGAMPAGVPRLQRNPTPGTLRLSEAGSTPRGDLPALRELPDFTEGAAGGSGAGAAPTRATARSTSSGPSQQQPPVDLGQLMQMAMGALGGAGGPPSGSGAPDAGDGAASAPPGGVRSSSGAAAAGGGRGGGEPDLSGLMQMMGGLMGGGAGGGGMGGLLQIAGQMASDPAMQPLINNVASAVLGGGGGAGGASGLGSLLSGLLGGPAPGGSGRPSVTITSMDVLDSALPPEQAAEWRRVIEVDEAAQQEEAAALAAPLSEVYLAGGPVQRQGLLSQLTDPEEQ